MNKNKSLILLLFVVFISLITSVGIFVRAYSQKNGIKKPFENVIENQTSNFKSEEEIKLNTLKKTDTQVNLSLKYNLQEKSVSLILTSPTSVTDGEIVLTYPKLINFVKNDSSEYFATIKPIETTNENNNTLRLGLLGSANKAGTALQKMDNVLVAKIYFSSLTGDSISIVKTDTQFFDDKGAQMILTVL